MTRNEHEEIEALASIALAGLLAAGSTRLADEMASDAFDIAEAFQKEKLKRIGEKPPFDC